MPHYEWSGEDGFRDSRNDRVVDPGEVVELDESIGGPQPQMVEVDDPTEDEEITCAEGDCSRSVDEEGQFCWQHEPE